MLLPRKDYNRHKSECLLHPIESIIPTVNLLIAVRMTFWVKKRHSAVKKQKCSLVECNFVTKHVVLLHDFNRHHLFMIHLISFRNLDCSRVGKEKIYEARASGLMPSTSSARATSGESSSGMVAAVSGIGVKLVSR